MGAGVRSSVKEVQALSLMTVAKMVQKAGPEHIRPQLARLVPALLESLSGMEVRSYETVTSLQYLPSQV